MSRSYWSSKTEADGLNSIQVWKLKEWGFLGKSTYNRCSITWTNSRTGYKSDITAHISTSPDDPYMQAIYAFTSGSTGESQKFDYKIPLTTTPCNFGGKRYWFICPWHCNGQYCGKRVGVLYLGHNGLFACRHCLNLTYQSRNEDRSFIKRHPIFLYFEHQSKIENVKKVMKIAFYKGRPTRKMRRILRLESKANNHYGIF